MVSFPGRLQFLPPESTSQAANQPQYTSSPYYTISRAISTPAAERLASGAEVCAAVLHHDPLNGAAANRAGLTSSMSNLEIEMGCAQLALGADVAIHTGAFAADGCPQNSADTIM